MRDPEAHSTVNVLLNRGDPDQILKLFNAAAKQDHALAITALAFSTTLGILLNNPMTWRRLIFGSAKLGDPSAQYYLVCLY